MPNSRAMQRDDSSFFFIVTKLMPTYHVHFTVGVSCARDYPDIPVTFIANMRAVLYTNSRHFVKSRRINETPRFAITRIVELYIRIIFDFRYNRLKSFFISKELIKIFLIFLEIFFEHDILQIFPKADH